MMIILLYWFFIFASADEHFMLLMCGHVQKLAAMIVELESEEKALSVRQADLKKTLYSRFGNSINLENS